MSIHERKFIIGRSPDCDIVLADESVSRKHAELLLLADGKVLATDCRSTQGTGLIRHGGVKAQSIRQELVGPFDTLCFGEVSIPVKDLLQAIHLKYLPQDGGSKMPEKVPVAPLPPEGERLVRCSCGAIKIRQKRCEVCGA